MDGLGYLLSINHLCEIKATRCVLIQSQDVSLSAWAKNCVCVCVCVKEEDGWFESKG